MLAHFVGQSQNEADAAKSPSPDDQKQDRLEIWMELQKKVKDDPDFLFKDVVGDVSWVYGCNPEQISNHASRSLHLSPRLKKAWQVDADVFLALKH